MEGLELGLKTLKKPYKSDNWKDIFKGLNQLTLFTEPKLTSQKYTAKFNLGQIKNIISFSNTSLINLYPLSNNFNTKFNIYSQNPWKEKLQKEKL